MGSRSIIEGHLFERNDLQRVDALEAEAQRVVEAWLSKLKAGMAALFSVRKAGDLKTYDWNKTLHGLNTLDFGNLHFVFRSSGGTSGEFKIKGRDTYATYRGTDVIDINCEVFGLLRKINECATSYLYTKQRKKCREDAYALLAEIERSLQTNDRLLGMPVIDLLVHELTHRDDHAHKDLTGVMRKGDVELSKKGVPTRAEINTQYMSTDHEYNAYCTHAISGARRRFSSTPPENFSDYADVFMAHFGKAHFSLMSVAHRRKVMARAYDAFAKLWPRLVSPSVTEGYLRESENYTDEDEAHEDKANRVIAAFNSFVTDEPLHAVVKPYTNPSSGDVQAVELTDFYADVPGSGVGTRVLSKLLELADEAGISVVTWPEGHRSRDFYLNRGFERSRSGGYLVHYPPLPDDWDE